VRREIDSGEGSLIDMKNSNKKFLVPDDIFQKLESFGEDMDLPLDIVVKHYQKILKYFDGNLKYFHALTEFENHYFQKNRRKYQYKGEENGIQRNKKIKKRRI